MELFDLFAQLDLKEVPQTRATNATLQNIVAVIAIIAGAIAVLIIVLAGLRYITSRGNPNETAKAKDAIIYAVVGLIIIISAFSIVNYVVLGVG